MAHDENASALKRLVRNKTELDVPAPLLELFKVNISGFARLALSDFEDKIRHAMPKEPLEATDKIYPSGSPEDDENLHIVAVVPTYALGGVAFFDKDDVKNILKVLDYKIDYISSSHPFVAKVSSVADNSKPGFLKFSSGKEISILHHLSAIDSPRNHTVPGVRSWPVRGGHVISMPSAGSRLTDLRNPSAQLWSVAQQMFKAVDFMHQHGVAHLDLKPDNVLIPPDGGCLSIIDFDAAVRIKSVNTMFCGTVGTSEYIPPEVEAGRGRFSAMHADSRSCGKILRDLCNICSPSKNRKVLLQII